MRDLTLSPRTNTRTASALIRLLIEEGHYDPQDGLETARSRGWVAVRRGQFRLTRAGRKAVVEGRRVR